MYGVVPLPALGAAGAILIPVPQFSVWVALRLAARSEYHREHRRCVSLWETPPVVCDVMQSQPCHS